MWNLLFGRQKGKIYKGLLLTFLGLNVSVGFEMMYETLNKFIHFYGFSSSLFVYLFTYLGGMMAKW